MTKYEKILLFYNPHAGNRLFSDNLDTVIAAFQRDEKIVVPVRAGDINMLDSILSGEDGKAFSKIIAAGGDGTVNYVVNTMIKNDITAPLALFPSGTANDIAHYFGIPLSFEEMLKIATTNNYAAMDVGVANGRAFVNVLAAGVIVDASQRTDPALKNSLGLVAYYIRALMDLPRIHPIPVKITLQGEVVETDMNAVLIMNGRGAGGFKSVAPHSRIDDGKLEVLLVHNVPFKNWASLILSVIMGEHENNPFISFYSAESLRIEAGEELVTDIDGEMGVPLPVDVSVLPRRLKICVPENYSADTAIDRPDLVGITEDQARFPSDSAGIVVDTIR